MGDAAGDTAKSAEAKASNAEKRKIKKFKGDNGKSKTVRPNHFLGIRIQSKRILGRMHAVQNNIINQNAALSRAVVPVLTAHITLCVLYLNGAEDIDKAADILRKSSIHIKEILENKPKLFVTLSGIGNFRKEVVFTKIVDDENLQKLTKIADVLRDNMPDFVTDHKPFTPHITLMKLSKMPFKEVKKVKRINPSLYNDFTDMEFGVESLSDIQLLAMMGEKQPDGYYACKADIGFDDTECEAKPDTSFSLVYWAEYMAISCLFSSLHELTRTESRVDTADSSSSQQNIKYKLEKFKEKINSPETIRKLRTGLADAHRTSRE